MTPASSKPKLPISEPHARRHRARRLTLRWGGALTVLVIVVGFALLTDRALDWRAQRDALLVAATGHGGPEPMTTLVRAVFYGDSITTGFPLRALLPPGVVAENRGVGGEGIDQIVSRYLDEADGPEHDVVVLQGGINNLLGADLRGEPEAEAVERVVAAYRTALSDARRRGLPLVILAVHPVTGRFLMPHSRAVGLPTTFDVARVNRMVQATDEALRALCETEGATFVDSRAVLAASDGRLDRAYATPDGYHLNVFGYRRLTEMIPRLRPRELVGAGWND